MVSKTRKQFFHLRYPAPLNRPVFWDELGVQAQINGVILSARDIDTIMWLPWQSPTEMPIHALQPSVEDWLAVLQATDDPHIFETDETGIVKAIHRKCMRAIGGALQWQVWRRDNFRCMYCGVEGNGSHPLTVDHFIPVELGGSDEIGNLISCCRACNKAKGSLSPEKYCELENKDYLALDAYLHGKASALFISHLA
jgi:hypothetical protein